ncbi:MAG: hypothetical protein J3K34DRAFT_32675 [Monoraphidium minutum]|nr:MAG: hypothetical protein J3K34DRAFT_32675 [Monoraphidium minutum]
MVVCALLQSSLVRIEQVALRHRQVIWSLMQPLEVLLDVSDPSHGNSNKFDARARCTGGMLSVATCAMHALADIASSHAAAVLTDAPTARTLVRAAAALLAAPPAPPAPEPAAGEAARLKRLRVAESCVIIISQLGAEYYGGPRQYDPELATGLEEAAAQLPALGPALGAAAELADALVAPHASMDGAGATKGVGPGEGPGSDAFRRALIVREFACDALHHVVFTATDETNGKVRPRAVLGGAPRTRSLPDRSQVGRSACMRARARGMLPAAPATGASQPAPRPRARSQVPHPLMARGSAFRARALAVFIRGCALLGAARAARVAAAGDGSWQYQLSKIAASGLTNVWVWGLEEAAAALVAAPHALDGLRAVAAVTDLDPDGYTPRLLATADAMAAAMAACAACGAAAAPGGRPLRPCLGGCGGAVAYCGRKCVRGLP